MVKHRTPAILSFNTLKNTTKTLFFFWQQNKQLPKSEFLRWSVYIFWSSCNLFEAIERFTILFLKHVWSSNKKVTDVISPYRSYSQVFLCLRITRTYITLSVSRCSLTNTVRLFFHPVFFVVDSCIMSRFSSIRR